MTERSSAPDSGRAPRRAGDATRQRLLRAAERLFGAHGVDAVSLNEIVHAAKVNSAAIHYHFRSREGLISAIMDQRKAVWSPRRRQMLADLESRDDVTARDVVLTMVEPIAALKAYPWGADYLKFLAAVASHPRYAQILHTVGDEYRASYLKQFARVTPHLPDHIRIARFSYMHEFVYHALASGDHRVALWLSSIGESPDSWTADDFIDMVTGAIVAPVHHP